MSRGRSKQDMAKQAKAAAEARWARKRAQDAAVPSIEPTGVAPESEQVPVGLMARLAQVAEWRAPARKAQRAAAPAREVKIEPAHNPAAPYFRPNETAHPTPSARAAAQVTSADACTPPGPPARPGDGTPPVPCVHGCGRMLTPGSQIQHDRLGRCRVLTPPPAPRPISPAGRRPGRPNAPQARSPGVRLRCFQCAAIITAPTLTEADKHFQTSAPCAEALGFTATAMRWIKP